MPSLLQLAMRCRWCDCLWAAVLCIGRTQQCDLLRPLPFASSPPLPPSPPPQGKFVTSRNLRERLFRELERNLAMKVEDGETADTFLVSGRGTLHITILIENM